MENIALLIMCLICFGMGWFSRCVINNNKKDKES